MAPPQTRAQSAAASHQGRSRQGTPEEEVPENFQEQLPTSPSTLQFEIQRELDEIQARRANHQLSIQLARARLDEAAGFPLPDGPAPFTLPVRSQVDNDMQRERSYRMKALTV